MSFRQTVVKRPREPWRSRLGLYLPAGLKSELDAAALDLDTTTANLTRLILRAWLRDRRLAEDARARGDHADG